MSDTRRGMARPTHTFTHTQDTASQIVLCTRVHCGFQRALHFNFLSGGRERKEEREEPLEVPSMLFAAKERRNVRRPYDSCIKFAALLNLSSSF